MSLLEPENYYSMIIIVCLDYERLGNNNAMHYIVYK